MSAPPGWFQDPQRPSGHLRWWDGQAWTEQRVAPHDAPVPAAWSPIAWARLHPISAVMVAVFGIVVLYGIAESAEEPGDREAAPAISQAGVAGGPDREPEVRPKPSSRSNAPPPRTYLVTKIVDGDTVRLGSGETVRLVGIDAPEAGRCGFGRATDTLTRLVLGKQVRLRGADEARDRYGRLLKYVDVGRHDAGLRLIKNGLAVARYDSRDGYGAHPRETLYVAADERTPPVACK